MSKAMSASFKGEVTRALRELAQICADGELGYETAARDAESPALQTLFARRAEERATFAHDLALMIARLDGLSPPSGTARGAIHRGWMDARKSLGGLTDRTLVDECLRGETAAIQTYERAHRLVRRLVRAQLTRIREARADLERVRQALADEAS
jgi:uncharacterized protein (TIGR02284 family)